MIQTLWNNLRKITGRTVFAPKSYGITDTGLKRDHNEDSIFFSDRYALYLVADGMGGHDQGEVASSLAVKTIVENFEKRNRPSFSLVEAIEEANRAIYNYSPTVNGFADSSLHMGTTLVACFFEKGTLSLAHVGDSRAYRLRQSRLEQLTKDHSLIQGEEGGASGRSRFKNIITRALGLDSEVMIDLKEEEVQAGDLILLCSDGLTRMVEDEQIEKIIGTPKPLETKCQSLITAANQNGGKDNISSLLIQF